MSDVFVTCRAYLLTMLAMLMLWTPSAADAQVISAPPRSRDAVDPQGNARHEVSVSSSLLGGYDADTAAQLAGDIEGLRTNNYAAFADGAMRYLFMEGIHSIETTGRGYVDGFPGSDVDPGVGGDGRVEVGTGFGRTRLSGGGAAHYEPFFTLGTFSPLQTEVEGDSLPDASPINGVRGQQSWLFESSASISRQWTAHHGTNARYSYAKRERQGTFGRDFSSKHLDLGYEFSMGRAGSIGVTYAYLQTEFQVEASSSAGQMTSHSPEFEAHRTIRVSRTRRISIAGALGAQRVEGVLDGGQQPYQYWAPSGRAGVEMDIGRSWTLAADYLRSVQALDAIGAQTFPSDILFVRTGGGVVGGLDLAISGGYANGRVGSADQTGEYRNYTVTGQLSYGISRYWAALLSYNRYDYRLRGVASGPGEPPSEVSRGSVRAGLTLLLPLINTRSPGANPRSRDRS